MWWRKVSFYWEVKESVAEEVVREEVGIEDTKFREVVMEEVTREEADLLDGVEED